MLATVALNRNEKLRKISLKCTTNFRLSPEDLRVKLECFEFRSDSTEGVRPPDFAIALPGLIGGDAMAKTEGASGTRIEECE